MKKYLSILFCALLCVAVAYPKYLGDMDGNGTLTLADVTKLVNILMGTESNYDATLADVNQDSQINEGDVSALVEMILGERSWVEADESDTLYIYYSNTETTYNMPSSWTEVMVDVSGGDVTVVNNDATREYVTVLSGTCDNGSFTYLGSYKTTVVLNGLSLTSDNCPFYIYTGKRLALELADGTENTLTDGSSNSIKSALYCKGHLEISKGGSLTVTGNKKHAISSSEYMLIKKTAGTITVDGAVADGIHVGQYFQMNGGAVNISGTGADAIQAEVTKNATDEQNGQMIINGGTIDITLQCDSAAAMKSDSLLHITDGTITIETTGDSDKALSSNANIEIDGGTIDITQSGGYIVETTTDDNGDTIYDPSYVVGLKADNCIVINDGTLTITNTADGGRGMKADKDINIEGGTLTVYANGAGGVLDTSGASSGSTETPASYKLYFSLPSTATSSNTGGFNPGGSSSTSLAWSNVNLYTSSGTQVATFSTQSSIAGSDGTTLTFYVYDFGAATSGSYYVTASYTATSSGGMGGPGGGSQTSSGTYTSSTFALDLTGSNVYKSVTATKSSSGGWGGQSSSSFTFTLSDVTSNFINGSVAAEEGDTYSAACVKADGNINLNGGTLTMAHLGESSKGIKADNTVTLAGTTVSDAARGTYLVVGSDASYCTSVKCGSYQGTGG